MKTIFTYTAVVLIYITAGACKKDWLDEKSDISRIVPTTLEDMQLLLNNSVLNQNFTSLAEVSADNFVFSPALQLSSSTIERNAYTWQPDVFIGVGDILQWNNTYSQVFITNVALEGLEKIKATQGQQTQWDDLKGQALFFRAKAFYDLLVIFTKPYDVATAGSDPGIPLRLKSDIAAPTTRATLQESFDQVISDLKQSIALLKETPAHKAHPSKAAAMAFLARVHLSMSQYDEALKYADDCLNKYSTLIDFNTLAVSASNPFKAFNDETFYFSRQAQVSAIPASWIAPELYNSYSANDLRKVLYFKSAGDGFSFKASYTGSSTLFGGFASNELYLIRAECYARKGNIQAAMDDLNRLLLKRYQTGSFIPLTSVSADEALKSVLLERRKELIGTALRWQDLRRLNHDPRFATTLIHSVNGQEHVLPPNSPKYTFPIPDYIINATGIAQNRR